MTILVTGATGSVGRNVLNLLLEAGVPVRATSRDPGTADLPDGVDVRAVDLHRPDSLADALTDVRKVYLFPAHESIDATVRVLEAAGVDHVVLLSSIATTYENVVENPITMRHLVVERALEASSVEWTFLQPGTFAGNTLRLAKSIRDNGVARLPYLGANLSAIHELDIAEVAVRALLDDRHRHAAYRLTGPESITQRRQIELIAEAIGRPVRAEEQPRDEAHAELSRWAAPQFADVMLDFLAADVHRPAIVTDLVEKITGHPARTFAQWAVDHRADFA
jgi:uncharacterized protein YbjT (DUF2867 family)